MAYTLTQDSEILDSGVSETVVVAQDSGGTNDPVSIAIDYTGYLARIATALETIATNTTNIATQLTPLISDGNGERFADQIARLRYLADPELDDDSSSRYAGSGIRTSQPYSPILNALLFKGLILEGGILVVDPAQVTDADAQKTAESFDKIVANSQQVQSLATRRLNDLLDSLQQFNQFK